MHNKSYIDIVINCESFPVRLNMKSRLNMNVYWLLNIIIRKTLALLQPSLYYFKRPMQAVSLSLSFFLHPYHNRMFMCDVNQFDNGLVIVPVYYH